MKIRVCFKIKSYLADDFISKNGKSPKHKARCFVDHGPLADWLIKPNGIFNKLFDSFFDQRFTINYERVRTF